MGKEIGVGHHPLPFFWFFQWPRHSSTTPSMEAMVSYKLGTRRRVKIACFCKRQWLRQSRTLWWYQINRFSRETWGKAVFLSRSDITFVFLINRKSNGSVQMLVEEVNQFYSSSKFKVSSVSSIQKLIQKHPSSGGERIDRFGVLQQATWRRHDISHELPKFYVKNMQVLDYFA